MLPPLPRGGGGGQKKNNKTEKKGKGRGRGGKGAGKGDERPKSPQGDATAKSDRPCFAFLSGRCDRGENCSFHHCSERERTLLMNAANGTGGGGKRGGQGSQCQGKGERLRLLRPRIRPMML